jgi:hypothetical protein
MIPHKEVIIQSHSQVRHAKPKPTRSIDDAISNQSGYPGDKPVVGEGDHHFDTAPPPRMKALLIAELRQQRKETTSSP